MARNEHKKVLEQLSEAYQNVINENTEATSASFGDNKGHDGPWKNPRRKRSDSGAGAEERDRQEEHPATRAAEGIIGADVMWDGRRQQGIVHEVDVESGVAKVIDYDGGEHDVELGEFDVVIDPNTETPEEFKHHYGIEDAEDSTTIRDIIDQSELDLPLTPDLADALQNVMDAVYSKR